MRSGQKIRLFFYGFEYVCDNVSVGDTGSGGIRFLGACPGQPIHGLYRAQDVDMRNAFAFGVITGLNIGAGKDRDNAVLNIEAVLAIPAVAETGFCTHQGIVSSI